VDMFEPSELELLICGNPVLDFGALREGTKYADGFMETSQAVQYLWYILLHDFSDEERKLFLKFVSGSDRSPIEGLSKLEFVVSRNGADDDRLPSAHTCFNHLLLPDYTSIDVMKTKLRYAISHSEGFGLR
jgi:ubiquitin-protein ligase E3 A